MVPFSSGANVCKTLLQKEFHLVRGGSKVYNPVLRLMAYLFCAYSILTIIVSFFPIYFRTIGMSGQEVGLLLAVGPLASIFAQPFWGYMSDRIKSIKKILLLALTFTSFIIVLLFQVNHFYGFLVSMFVLFLFLSPVTALGDSLAQKTAIANNISFGRIRMWGSLGFGITSLLVGYILGEIGLGYISFPLIVLTFLAFFFALLLQDVPSTKKPPTVLDAVKLAGNRKLLAFLFVILFISIPHRANDTFLGIYITDLGGSEAFIGWAWFIGVSAEATIFALAPFWFKRYQATTFIIIATSVYIVRWILMGFAISPVIILFLQVLHGLSFGIFYICAFFMMSKLVPEQLQATGHVLFTTMFFGVSGIVGSMLGGYIIEMYSTVELYHFLSILTLLGLIGIGSYKYVCEQKGIAKVHVN